MDLTDKKLKETKISRLEHYIITNKNTSISEKRTRFFYVYNDYLWEEYDVKEHIDFKKAFEIAKKHMIDLMVPTALKELFELICDPFINPYMECTVSEDGMDYELSGYIFNRNVLNENSKINRIFKKFISNNWQTDFGAYYFRCLEAKNLQIHVDSDKKTLYNHYFDSLEEFDEEISFFEFYNRYVIEKTLKYWGLIEFKPQYTEYGDYYLIDDTITRNELSEFLNKKDIRVTPDLLISDNKITWAAFAYYYGQKEGLSECESRSFASVLTYTMFLSKIDDILEIEWNTNEFYNEHDIIKFMTNLLDDNMDSAEYKTKKIVSTLMELYKKRISKFEYKNEGMYLNMSKEQYGKFMKLPGESKDEKMDFIFDNISVLYAMSDIESFDQWSERVKGNGNVLMDYMILEKSWAESEIQPLEEKYDDEIVIVDFNRGFLSKYEEMSQSKDNTGQEFANEKTLDRNEKKMAMKRIMDSYGQSICMMRPEEINDKINEIRKLELSNRMRAAKVLLDEYENARDKRTVIKEFDKIIDIFLEKYFTSIEDMSSQQINEKLTQIRLQMHL